ncbi:MAG: DNA polymerase [Candidatus Paceibacterota bacterium]
MAKPEKKTTKRLVLLDTHAILHRAYHALPDFSSKTGEPTGALFGLVTMLLKIISELQPDFIVATYDVPKPTFRKIAYEDYKGKRGKTDDALVAQIIRSKDVFEAFSIPVYEKEGFEADDVIGSIVAESSDLDLEVIIASGDMDTLQLVEGRRVQVYTLRKGIKDTILYDEKAVKKRFGFGPKLLPDYKSLRGDPSDNIPGVKGIGEKTATTLVCTYGTIEKLYRALEKDKAQFIEKTGVTERIVNLLLDQKEESEFSKMLALIRRDAEIKFSAPSIRWDEVIDLGKAEHLFKELDFRTLSERLKNAVQGMGKKDESENKKKKEGTPLSGEQATLGGLYGGVSTKENVDSHKLRKVSVALWVLDSNLTNPSYEDILRYTETDTLREAEAVIHKKLKEADLEFVYKGIEEPLIPVIEAMEKWGIKLDLGALKELSRDYHAKREAFEKEVFEIAGVEFNMNSPKQLGEVLFDTMKIPVAGISKTSTGARSTRESELEKLRDKHPVVEKIFEYRELQKLLSTYIDVLPTLVDAEDRLHTTFLQHGTTTGRISSQNPNLQNIPIKTEQGRHIRRAFIAEKEHVLLSLDYSQIELRVAAFLSRDEKLIEIFKSNGDAHTSVAAQVFNVPEEAVDKEMRRRAKVINFGILYGMGVNALKKNLGTSRAEAQEFLNEYFHTFKGLSDYLEISKVSARQKGYAETFFGRKRRFDDINSPIPYIRASAERMAINAPIQGTQADIIKQAMVAVETHLKKEKMDNKCSLVLQIHDELVFEVHKDVVQECAQEIKRIMETIVPLEQTEGIPLRVEASYGKNWLEMENI